MTTKFTKGAPTHCRFVAPDRRPRPAPRVLKLARSATEPDPEPAWAPDSSWQYSRQQTEQAVRSLQIGRATLYPASIQAVFTQESLPPGAAVAEAEFSSPLDDASDTRALRGVLTTKLIEAIGAIVAGGSTHIDPIASYGPAQPGPIETPVTYARLLETLAQKLKWLQPLFLGARPAERLFSNVVQEELVQETIRRQVFDAPLRETEEILKRLLDRRNGEGMEAWLNLGIVYAAQNDFERGIAALQKAIDQSGEATPELIHEAHYHLGRVLTLSALAPRAATPGNGEPRALTLDQAASECGRRRSAIPKTPGRSTTSAWPSAPGSNRNNSWRWSANGKPISTWARRWGTESKYRNSVPGAGHLARAQGPAGLPGRWLGAARDLADASASDLEGEVSMILVTGATGMTGQFVVQELQQRGYAVRVLVRESSLDAAPPHTDLAIGDLADPASLRRASDSVDGIIHTACTFTDSAVDIAAMQALLDGWRAGPFVFVSSLDVYGFVGDAPVTEEHPLSETYGDYGRGKVICERLLTTQAAANGRTDFVCLRAPHILGPHPKMWRRFIDPVTGGAPIVLPGADESEWSQYCDAWIDVRDLAWICAESLLKPAGGALNVLAGHFVWHDFYAAIIQLRRSSSQIVHKPRAEFSDAEWHEKLGLAQTWRFDDSKLRQQLGFVPRYTLQQTLTDSILEVST